MVAVFFFAATPHDFIHDEVVSHSDTIDSFHAHSTVSKIHIHCEFLRESLSPSLPGEQPQYFFAWTARHLQFAECCPTAPVQYVFTLFLRGPPSAC